MEGSDRLARKDTSFVQIVDVAFADAAARSGSHLVCQPGCSQCCTGAFVINQLDALRLRRGLEQLAHTDPERAARVERRAREYVELLGPTYPGDTVNGLLHEDPDSMERFEDFGDDEPCPALDPGTRTCDLYAARPLTCRVFGPPVRSEEGLGVCELCFTHATPEEIERCEMQVDPDTLELQLNQEAEELTSQRGSTVVAWALLDSAGLYGRNG